MLQRCWAMKPKERPSIAEVCSELQALGGDTLLAQSAAMSPHLPAAAASPANTSSASNLDPEVEHLFKELLALQIGTSSACTTFAKLLSDEGVMNLQRLRPMATSKARALLQRAGMKELQIDTVMEACSPPSPLALAPADTTRPSQLQVH